MPKEELQPCPFCGSDDLNTGDSWSCGDGYVQCRKCESLVSAESQDEAFTRWNLRVHSPNKELVELLARLAASKYLDGVEWAEVEKYATCNK